MSGLEFLAVAGCVAALCSAYCDGSKLVAQMRAKRRERRLLRSQSPILPAEEEQTEGLQNSLVSGNKDVRQQFERDMRRLGQPYEEGDVEARQQLTHIIIVLQQQVIENLHRAWRDDDFNNFQPLLDTSDDTRNDAILCLINLQKRMAHVMPIRASLTSPIMSPSHLPISPPDSSYPTFATVSSMGYPNQSFQGYVEPESHRESFGPLPVSLGFPSRINAPAPLRKDSATREIPSMLAGTPVVMQPWPTPAPPPPPKDSSRKSSMGGDSSKEKEARYPVPWLRGRVKTIDSTVTIIDPSAETNTAPPLPPWSTTRRVTETSTANTSLPTPTSPRGSKERIPIIAQMSQLSVTGPYSTSPAGSQVQTPVPAPPPYQNRSPRSANAERAPLALSPAQSQPEGEDGSVEYNPWVTSPTSQKSNAVRLQDAMLAAATPHGLHPALRPDSQHTSSSHSHTLSDDMSWAFSSDSGEGTPHSSPPPSRKITNECSSGALPGEDNKFLGFCKGSWRMQIGERSKAIKEQRIPMGMMGTIPYWCCSGKKCNFEGRIVLGGPNGKEKLVDRQIFAFTGRGYYIRYRWTLLHKLHVPSKARGAAASGNHMKQIRIEERHAQDSFKCIFCCVSNPNAPVIGGISSLMLHLGREHIGPGKEPVGALLLDRVKCISGFAAAEDEDWDVNLIEMPAGSKVEEFYGSPVEGSFVSR